MRNLSIGIHAIVVLATAAAFTSNSVQAKKSKETVLYSFNGTNGDGGFPRSQMAIDNKGNLYGTASTQGANGDGIIFKLAPNGTETILHTFSGSDGQQPEGNVILVKGDLYGVTFGGGDHNLGAVYRLNRNGTYDLLYSFTGGSDGSSPSGWIVWDKGGFVYGAAESGGAGGAGVIFKVAGNGKETVVHTFVGNDGAYPISCLKLPDGTVYGETFGGGDSNAGAVFKIATDGTETVLYSFTGGDDGGGPAGPMLNDNSSNLYGTTGSGGANSAGTAFRVTPKGKFTLLHTFGGPGDGVLPSGLVGGPDALYGTTIEGGSGHGVVYKMSVSGGEKVLYRFTGGTDGGQSYTPPIVDKHGNIYGTAAGGGAHGYGVVFALEAKK